MTQTAYERTNWAWQNQQTLQRANEWLEWQIQSWLSRLNPDLPIKGLGTIANFVNIGIRFLAVILLLWLIWRLFIRFLPMLRRLKLKQPSSPRTAAPVVLSSQQWVERSRQYAQVGDYYLACRCLYLAMLEQLHERKLIPHQLSRTDREYQLLVWQLSNSDSYEELLQVHQLLCFGDRPATAQRYQQCQQAYTALSRTENTL